MTANSKIKINLDSLKSRREWKRHKVKDGHNLYRILPPFGEASNGYPYRKWQIIWGLADPESGRVRPFASSMTSEKRCPVTELVAQLKIRAEEMETQLKTAGTSKEDVAARMKSLRDLINNLSPKTVYVYNAVDKAGEVGLLELKSTAHKDMKTKMNQYIQDYNQDPTSLGSATDDSGVWFDITRSGTFFDTEYKVEKCQAKVKTATGISFVDDRSPLPESVVENYDNLAYDLSSIYQMKTYDELQEVLNHNLPLLLKEVPDADLSVAFNLAAAAPVAAKAAVPAAAVKLTKPAGTVLTKIDDGDDDVDGNLAAPAPALTARTNGAGRKPAVVDDDFMAEADAILRG